MPTIALTQTFVNNSTCPENKQRIDYFDTKLRGLVLKILKSERKSYYIRYNDSYGRTREKRFADADILSLADARKQAKKWLSQITLGENPFFKKAEKKEILLYKDFIKQRYLPHMKIHKRSWKVDETLLRLHILPIFGDLYLDEITKDHAFELFRRHQEQRFKPASTNRMMSVASRTLSCAIEWDIKGIKENPINVVKKLKENNHRDRYLNNKELRRLLHELNRSEHPRIREIVTMLILTGARRNEVLQARWSDMDFQRNIWRIEINKSGVTRYVPLSEGAVNLLHSIERYPGVDNIFYNPKTLKPYVNIFHPWNEVRQLAGIPDIRLHDLRHSYASFLVNEGRTIYEVQKILGHAHVKTTQRYAHLNNKTLLAATNTVSSYVARIAAQ